MNTSIHTAATRDNIINALNTDRAYDNGLSNRDAHVNSDGSVFFTYPAPVASGACIGRIEVRDDGRIYDDTNDQEFADFAQWLADLASMMEV